MVHVRVGRGSTRLTHVDGQVVRYVDETGHAGEVVLRPRRMMGPLLADEPGEGPRYVGRRKLDEAPWLVTLRGDQPTTFEFDGYEAAYELLLMPLREHGLVTFDTT